MGCIPLLCRPDGSTPYRGGWALPKLKQRTLLGWPHPHLPGPR